MPATGNRIVIAGANARGIWEEGYLDHTNSSAPKPGTVMQIQAFEPVGGKLVWDVFGAGSGTSDVLADGNRRLIAVLCPFIIGGQTATTAYAASTSATARTRIKLYLPLPGDQLNMLFTDVSGTGDDHGIGDLMIVDNGTGKLVLTVEGSPESEPFQVMRTVTDVVGGDYLSHVMFTGY